MRLLILFISAFLASCSWVYSAESFSFSGIQWTDSRDVIGKKLKESGELNGLRERNNDIREDSLGSGSNFPYALLEYNKKLKDIDTKLAECGSQPIVAGTADININFSDTAGVLNRGSFGGRFYFSAFDEKLLAYIVGIKNDKYDVVLRALQEKYGPGQPLERQGRNRRNGKSGWHMWEADNELLFSPMEASGSNAVLYVNTAHLKDLIGPCMEVKKNNEAQDKANASKVF